MLRGPINRYVTEKTGRKFEITRHLDVGLGLRTVTVRLDGIEFANPAWARDPYLVQAERAEIDVRIWPLLAGRVVLPRIVLASPAVGLQMEADGRRTWAFGKDTSEEKTAPEIGMLQVDKGSVAFLAKHLGVDLRADVDFDNSRGEMPLDYRIKGTYKNQPLTAQGRTGNVMQLTKSTGASPPFPLEIDAAAGQTRLKASGTVAALEGFDGIQADFALRGQSLGELFSLLGVALPDTSPYALSGRVTKEATLWKVQGLQGKLGLSDIAGTMQFDQAQKVPQLDGALNSKVLDMDDLGPLIGLPPSERSAKAIEGVEVPKRAAEAKGGQGKVFPTSTLDLTRLRGVNADVKYTAERIRNVRDVPLDRGSVHVLLKDGLLTLDPLDLGVAGGKVAGAIRIDASQTPADIRATLQVSAVQINRLIPKVETMRTSLGRLDGRINLSGRGTSVASWLGDASGDVAAMTGRGEFSNLLLEFMGLDGAEIIKFFIKGDRNVVLRCAAVAFDVDKGLMSGRSLVFDTTDTVFHAEGHANLAKETLDFVIKPQPKDVSILSLRTPLVIGGTLGSPSVGVEAKPLIARGLAALALGAINPLLALAATVETGPGQNADCQEVLSEARTPQSTAAREGAAKGKAAKE